MNHSIVLSVSQVNRYIKAVMEADENLQTVFVLGEISNFTNHARSGHFYMTLKDESAAIRAVMFSASNRRLRFLPENGMRVLVRGRVTVFERDGQYQLYIDDMQPEGLGALYLALEQLKQRLAAEGLFDTERKRPLPLYPKCIALVTSPEGAALQDILQVLSRRFPAVRALLCPVQVQGEEAAAQIAAAIRQVSLGLLADLLIVGRGGGSLEELWAFNEEVVARAVAESAVPVISAVGHETDLSLCDLVADLRAPTPSAAAELAVPDRLEQQAYLSSLLQHGRALLNSRLRQERGNLRFLYGQLALRHPEALLAQRKQRLAAETLALNRAARENLRGRGHVLALLCGKLDALSPLKILERGYAAVYHGERPVTSGGEVQAGMHLDVRLRDAVLECTIDKITM